MQTVRLLKGKVSCVNHNKLHLPLHTWRWDAATVHTSVSTITRRSSTLSAQTLITVQVLCFAWENLIIFIFNPRHSDCWLVWHLFQKWNLSLLYQKRSHALPINQPSVVSSQLKLHADIKGTSSPFPIILILLCMYIYPYIYVCMYIYVYTVYIYI